LPVQSCHEVDWHGSDQAPTIATDHDIQDKELEARQKKKKKEKREAQPSSRFSEVRKKYNKHKNPQKSCPT